MTLLTRIAELEELARKAQKDASYMSRITQFVTAGEGRQFMYAADPATIIELCSALRKAVDEKTIIEKCLFQMQEAAKDLTEKLRKAVEAIDMLMLLSMDEDNVWDLARADEIRTAIRKYARACLKELECQE